MRTFQKICSGLITGFLALLVLFNLCTLIVRAVKQDPNAPVFGFSSAVVLTGSMADTISPNDMIITRAQQQYQAGDIILFRDTASTVTHRIAAVTPRGYVTKGDANNTADTDPVSQEQVIGKVICIIPKVGNVFLFFKTPLGMLLLTLILFAIIFVPGFTKKA